MRRGHLVCVRSRECELTRLAADRFIEAAAVLRDRYFVPTTCSITRAVNSRGIKARNPVLRARTQRKWIQMNWPLRAGHVVLWETADALVLCSSPLAPRANTVLPAPQLLICGKLRRASSKTKNLPDPRTPLVIPSRRQ